MIETKEPTEGQVMVVDPDALAEIIMVQKCGVSAAMELGWGAGAGKLTIVLLADYCEPELMVKMADYICLTLDEVIETLNRFSGRRFITP